MIHPERRMESIKQIAYEEGFHDGYSQAMSEMPEVIRCNDCIFGLRCLQTVNGNPSFDFVTCTKPYVGVGCGNHKPEWFCADGKRRE